MTRLALIALAVIALAAPLKAEEPFAQVTLIPGWETPRGTRMAGLRIDLTPGWKTYWRAPGEAGIPPVLSWEGSENIAAAELHWPVPEVFDTNGMRSIGYHDSVVIPVEFSLQGPGDAHVSGEIAMGVCRDICMPATVRFSADLPADGPRDAAIIAAMIDQPASAEAADVGDVVCAMQPIRDGLKVTATIDLPDAQPDDVVVIEATPDVWVSQPQTEQRAGQLTAVADLVAAAGQPLMLDRSAMRFTILRPGHAIDIRGCTGS